MHTSEITLEQAQAVIEAHREAEYAAKVAENQRYIGCYFRYRNSYGSDSAKWWMYAAVTSVDDLGTPHGWHFQQYPEGGIDISNDATMYVYPGNGYEEISATEFWRQAAKVRHAVIDRLSPTVAPAEVSR